MLNDYLSNNRDGRYIKRLECVDGFTMSVQASDFSYCSPRVSGADCYTEVEVGFPSAAPVAFMSYAEDPDAPTETVYGWVPVNLVEEEIERHGGCKGATK